MTDIDTALFNRSPHVFLPSDRKVQGKLEFVRVVSQGFGWQVREWVDEARQLWHIGPGYREYAGKARESERCGNS